MFFNRNHAQKFTTALFYSYRFLVPLSSEHNQLKFFSELCILTPDRFIILCEELVALDCRIFLVIPSAGAPPPK
jgi:hypothetical protein